MAVQLQDDNKNIIMIELIDNMQDYYNMHSGWEGGSSIYYAIDNPCIVYVPYFCII